MPAPALNQQAAPESPSPPPKQAPLPEKRPDAPPSEEGSEPDRKGEETPAPNPQAAPESPAPPPEEAPLPEKRPQTPPSEGGSEPARKGEEVPAGKKPLPDPRSASVPADIMPPEEKACRERLKALGAAFEERKAEHDAAAGCSIPYPLLLKTLGKSIELEPDAELNCAMAEAAVRFANDVMAPMAKKELGADLKSVGQASAYVCRPRHNGRKMSEHAFGNALDIAGFTLADGSAVEVRPSPPERDAKFLDAVRKAACGPFKTVLGPGSDADHALHFHFDLEPRRNGGTFCQ